MAKKATRKKSASKKVTKKTAARSSSKKPATKTGSKATSVRKKTSSSNKPAKDRWGIRDDLGADATPYIDALPPDLAPAGRRLHKSLLAAAPNVTACIKWGMPVYQIPGCPSMGGMYASLWKGKGYLRLGLYAGATLPDPEGLLQGEGKDHRHVRVTPSKVVPWKAIEALIKRSAAAARKDASA